MIADLLTHAPKKSINQNKLSGWLNNNLNVLLIGSHGVGKTTMILETFNMHLGTKWAFFNGATTDPWTSLIGIPTISENKQVLKYIRPEALGDDVEAIYIDELNRAKTATRNALLELIQFKSINGRKFPNLRAVWASVNPPKAADDAEAFDYDVEALDQAQVDRFQVIVQLPEEPDKFYFTKKYGIVGTNLVNWWNQQAALAKKIITPRRLEYVAQGHNIGLDLSDILPVCSNVKSLKNTIDQDQEEADFVEALRTKDFPKLITLCKKSRWREKVEQKMSEKVSPESIQFLESCQIDTAKVLKASKDALYTQWKEKPSIWLGKLLKASFQAENRAEVKEIQDALYEFEELKDVKYLKFVKTSGAEEQFSWAMQKLLKTIRKCPTYDRRKALGALSEMCPKTLNLENLHVLNKLLNSWAIKIQGLSIRNMGECTKKMGPINPDYEVHIAKELIQYYLLLSPIQLAPKPEIQIWFEKLEANGIRFLPTNKAQSIQADIQIDELVIPH